MDKKATISYLQIAILIIASFAFPYLIYHSSSSSDINQIKEKQFDFLETLGLIILKKLKEPILPMVSAQIQNYVCCKETNSDNICQYVPIESCKENIQKSPTECENTEFCKLGCCISYETGLIIRNIPKEDCLGEWFEDSACNIPEAQKGCCILGNQGLWTNEKNCEIESQFRNLPIEFRPEVNSEIECLFLTEKDEEGACVFESGDEISCEFTTLENCILKTGSETNFYKNTFCSNPELNTICKPHENDGCLENSDNVYWFDSCGNREEVKEECSILINTRCGLYRPDIDEEPEEGEYICRNLSCVTNKNGEEVVYKNGESWCEYEGLIGDGRDIVGSRHFRHICYMGEEIIEPCEDYRNQICVESRTELADGSEFEEASCRTNRWRSCYEYNNQQEGMAEKCEENPDCKIQGVHIDEFSFDVCVPNYPPGFDLKSSDPSRNGEMECSFGSQKCTIVYVKRISGWKCEINCGCEKIGFTQQMNDLCISLGDCGGYVNWVGEYTDDGYSSGAGRISGNQYQKNAIDNPNQEPAKPGDFGFSQFLGLPEGLSEDAIAARDSMLGMLGAGMGALGFLKDAQEVGAAASATSAVAAEYSISELTYIASDGTTSTGFEALANSANDWLVADPITGKLAEGGTLFAPGAEGGQVEIFNSAEGVPQAKAGFKLPEGFGNALAGIGAALSVSNFLQTGFGMDATPSYVIGGVIGLVVFMNPGLWWIGVALAIGQLIFGWGKTKTKVIEFDCLPWQAPAGGKDCDKCNEEDIFCSEYKCNSLGQTCEFINQGTSDEKCINNDPYDVSSPKITPNPKAIGRGYEYRNINVRGFEIKTEQGGCIDEYELVNYGIITDRPAQCKIGVSPLETYEQMPEYFGGKNSYITNHTNIIFIPSPAAFKNHYNLTEEQIAKLGDIKFYIKCKSINGATNTAPYVISSCVKPGPDLTAPRITKTIPEEGFVKYEETQKDLSFWVNEPSECKWSKEDKIYEKMENEITCQSELTDYGIYGWPCNTTLTGISENSSKVYIKCKDQPWETESSLRNAMQESYEYDLRISKNPLIIKNFKPKDGEKIIEGVEPISFDFRVETAGGAENGKAICRWEGKGYSDYFTETDSIFHKYSITRGIRGDYDINFKCEDVAGNIAEASTSFEIFILIMD